MPTFTYEAREQSGKVERGTREAESAEAVARELRAQGYFIVSIERSARPSPEQLEQLKRQVLAPVFYPVSSKHRAMFFSSLKALMSSGMSVSEGMGSLAKRTQNRILKASAAEMVQEAIRGRPMSAVMAKYPAAFPAVALAVMEAGEESGLIEQTAQRLAKYFDRAFEVEQMYRWHTFYPKVLLIALILFFQILVVVRDEAAALRPELVLSVRSLGAGRRALFRYVYIPASLPAVLTALRVSVGTAVAVLFIAETFATQAGLGYFIVVRTWGTLRYPQMYAGILAMSLLGLTLYFAIEALDRHVNRHLYVA